MRVIINYAVKNGKEQVFELGLQMKKKLFKKLLREYRFSMFGCKRG